MKNKLTGVGAAHPEFVQLGAGGKTREILFNNKCSDAVSLGGGICLCINHQGVCVRSVGNPHFAAVQYVVTPGLFSLKLHADHIRAGVVFTHRQRADFGAADEIREKLGLLGVGTITEDLIDAKV